MRHENGIGQFGAAIDVIVGASARRARQLERLGKQPLLLPTTGLIDLGAQRTHVHIDLLNQLCIPKIANGIPVSTTFGQVRTHGKYDVHLILVGSGNRLLDLENIEVLDLFSDHPKIQVLIGQDILNQCERFTYEGKAGIFSLEV